MDDLKALLAELQELRAAVAALTEKQKPRSGRQRRTQAAYVPVVAEWLRQHRDRQPIPVQELFFELQACCDGLADAFNGRTPWASFAARCLYSDAARAAGIRVAAGRVTLAQEPTEEESA